MASLPRMRRTAAIVFAPGTRDRAEDVLAKAIDRIGGYVGGILVTASIAGVSALLFFSILGLIGLGIPFAFPLAVFAALAGSRGGRLHRRDARGRRLLPAAPHGDPILAYFIVYQQIENYVIQPRIMKNAVNLSPAAAVIATLGFGSLGRFAGALLALPAAATIKVIFVEVFLRDRVAEGDVVAKEQLETRARRRRRKRGPASAPGRGVGSSAGSGPISRRATGSMATCLRSIREGRAARPASPRRRATSPNDPATGSVDRCRGTPRASWARGLRR